jgi:hypothetical protein
MSYVSVDSPLAHLATIVCPPWLNRKGTIFAMITFAFDAGGDDKKPMLTVAGFASSTEDWDKFTIAWTERLGRDGITFFHATDLDAFWGPFKHLQDKPNRRDIRKNLCADLMGIIKSHTYRKFACTIVNKDFQQMTAELREEFALCAYSLAGRTCEKHLREYMRTEYAKTTPFAVIFEEGDEGKGKLQKRLAEDSGLQINFRRKKDEVLDDGLIERGFVPLQAADWLAHELNLAAKKFPGTLESESQLRWPMQQFLGPPFGYMGMYELEDLKEVEKGIDLTKKIMEWESAIGLTKKRDRLSENANAKGKTA